jgi:hypothetical protein
VGPAHPRILLAHPRIKVKHIKNNIHLQYLSIVCLWFKIWPTPAKNHCYALDLRLFYNGAFSIASKNDLDDQNLLLATVHTWKKKQFKNRVFYGANINRYINTITIEINLTIIYFNIDQPFSSRFRTENHLLRHFR